MQLAVERLLAAWHPLRVLHVKHLVAEVAKAPAGTTDWPRELSLPPVDVERLVVAVKAAMEEGRVLALREAAHQDERLARRVEKAAPPEVDRKVGAYVAAAERLLAGGLVQSAAREAFRLAGTPAEVDAAAHVETILGDSAMIFEKDVLSGMATGAVNEGRYQIAEAILGAGPTSVLMAAEATSSIYALEILDGNTCDACAEIDGQEYATFDEARADYPGLGGGYVDCQGRERCRGSLVFVYGDEAAATPPPPIAPPVPPPAPPPPPVDPFAPVDPYAPLSDEEIELVSQVANIGQGGASGAAVRDAIALIRKDASYLTIMNATGLDMSQVAYIKDVLAGKGMTPAQFAEFLAKKAAPDPPLPPDPTPAPPVGNVIPMTWGLDNDWTTAGNQALRDGQAVRDRMQAEIDRLAEDTAALGRFSGGPQAGQFSLDGLNAYTSPVGEQINRYLRGYGPNDSGWSWGAEPRLFDPENGMEISGAFENAKFAGDQVKAMFLDPEQHAVLAEDTLLFRGIKGHAEEMRASIGKVMTDEGLVSTTTDQTVAPGFAGGSADGAILRVHAREGEKFLIGFPTESEIILQPGTRYLVVGETEEENSFVNAYTNAPTPTFDVIVLREGETAKDYYHALDIPIPAPEKIEGLPTPADIASWHQDPAYSKVTAEGDLNGARDHINAIADNAEPGVRNDPALLQIDALSRYSGAGYADMNDLLRKGIDELPAGRMRAETVQDVERLRAAYDPDGIASIVRYDTLVFRGTNLPREGIEDLVGSVQQDLGFVSTSIDRDTAVGFAQNRGDREKVLLKIHVREGETFLPGTSHAHENEMIFAPGSRYVIVSEEARATSTAADGVTQIPRGLRTFNAILLKPGEGV
jgi:hypothetical protein